MQVTRALALIGIAAALIAAATVRQVAAQPADRAHRGYLAVRVDDRGEPTVVEALNADRLFVPASVLKLVTTAAALEHLGSDYRWLTRLTSTAVVDAGGVVDGDLWIVPGADPTWGETVYDGGAAGPLGALADQLRARGVTRVAGDLVVDAGRFPGRPHPTGRPFGDLPYRLGTPATALAVDEATITVRVRPGPSLGAAARVEAPNGIEVVNLTTTVGRDRHGAGTLDFVPVWGTDTLLLRGEYPISEPPFVVDASDPAPRLRAARRLRAALEDAGVAVEGVTRLGSPTSGVGTMLAELRSRPLADLLEPILTESHNWYADMLALTLAREVAGSGRFDDGVEVIADFATGSPPGDGGPSRAPGVWIEDGSGLSAANLVTPETVVRLLTRARARPWWDVLADALATRDSGTLEMWPQLPPVAAKTGSIRHTVALAGILGPESATPVFFCYFINHHPERPGAARQEIAAALARWDPR